MAPWTVDSDSVASPPSRPLVEIHTADEVIRCADTALYLAKEGGRNRAVYHAGTPELIR